MKQHLTFTLLFFSLLNLTAQTSFNSKDLSVTRNDLETNEFKNDSTANALVLYEYGNSYFDKYDYVLKTEVKKKIKILNKEGFNKTNVTIYLYKSEDKEEYISNITATTYNLIDNKVTSTKLSEDQIFLEKYNNKYNLVKFALPNVKAGSTITYSYILGSPFMFKYKGWEFQSDIPKLYSEYRTSIPANYQYNIKLSKNDEKITPNCLEGPRGSYAGCTNTVYAMENIPAFIEEDYMTAKENYLARLEYELRTFQNFNGKKDDYTKTWKTADKEFKTDGDIGWQLSRSIKLNEHLNTTVINEKDSFKKASAIYKYIQDTYAWNGDYNIFKDVSVKNLIKNKSGNVSSINILLHNLLKEANIAVKPVLLSTRSNGFPTKIYPVISDFNYLIVQVTIDDKTYLLDATDDYLSFGEIPFRCLNSYGRLLDLKDGSYWIDIAPSKPSIIQFKADLDIDENSTISGSVNTRKTGYHALRSKKEYYSNSDSYKTNLENKYPNIEIFDHAVSSEGKRSSVFTETYNIEYAPDDSAENIYLDPFFIKFFKENPFKLQERTYPIDFGYKDTFYYIIKLNFGDYYTLLEKPENASFALPNNKGSVLFSSSIQNNIINLMFKISFKDAVYPPEYYPYLKSFMSKIIDIQNNSLILLKKK